MGKKNWNTNEITPKFVEIFRQKYPMISLVEPVDINVVISQNYNVSLEILRELYIKEVIDEKVEWNIDKKSKKRREELALEKFEKEKANPEDNFYELPIEERERLISDIYLSEKELDQMKLIEIMEAHRIANLTLQRIIKLETEGKIKLPYNAAQIILHLTEEPPYQEDYLIDYEYENWLSSYYDGVIPRKSNGLIDKEALDNIEIEVYCFQCGDIGAGNFMTYNGNIGADDGMFVISSNDYNELLQDKELFNDKGECINIPKLSARLGNVPLGSNPICIKQRIKLSQLSTSRGSLKTAYFGEFGPPLSTQGGYDENGNYVEGRPEAVVPQTTFLINGQLNPNVEIISHSKNISTEEFVRFAQVYLIKSEQYRETESIDHYTLTNNIDNDMEILEKFKEILTREEQLHISKLMNNLQSVMESDEDVEKISK